MPEQDARDEYPKLGDFVLKHQIVLTIINVVGSWLCWGLIIAALIKYLLS